MVKRRSALVFFSLIVGLGLASLALLEWITPTSGAYLSWEATAGPNKLKIGGAEAEWIAATPTAEAELVLTPQVDLEKEETPQPILALETEIELEIEGIGLYDAVNSTYAVSGEACARNIGENLTQGLSPLRLKVRESGDSIELAFREDLAPGASHCMPYQLAFDGNGGDEYTLQASVTINNYHGWLPGSENCPQASPCPHGPAAEQKFTLPVVETAPTDVPPAQETPPVEPGPTEVPVVEAVVVPVVESVSEPTPEAAVTTVEPEEVVTEAVDEDMEEVMEEATEEVTQEATEPPVQEPTAISEETDPEPAG